MPRPTQSSLLKPARKEHGGSLAKGHRKERRPIDPKKPIHIVFRSSLAKGDLSFLRFKQARVIEAKVYELAKASGVKIYRYANAGNHLHLLALPGRNYRDFLRAVGARVAQITTGA